MQKNELIAFILIGIILVVWMYINQPVPQPTKKIAKDTLNSFVAKQDSSSLPTYSQNISTKKEDNIIEKKTNKPERILTIETEKAYYEFTTKGAKIKKVFIKGHKNWYSLKDDKAPYYQKYVQLIKNTKEGELGIEFLTNEGKLFSDEEYDYNLNFPYGYYKINPKDSLSLIFELKLSNDKIIRKIFTLKSDSYLLKTKFEFIGLKDFINGLNYELVWKNGINNVEHNSYDEATYSNASVYAGDEQIIIDETSFNKKVKKEMNGAIDWVAIRNKYFTIALSPTEKNPNYGVFIEGKVYPLPDEGKYKIFSARIKTPIQKFNKFDNQFDLYIGPIQYDELKVHGKNFEKIVDFGSFFGLRIIIRPISEYVLLPLFKFLNSFISNFGLVIIIVSLIVKIALHPLSASSLKSMKKMSALQPKINELREKYKDDPQKMNQEMMKLYSTYGINPMGGCLPLLLQMPILIALWSLFNMSIEIRQQPFILWITNLSEPDVIFSLPFKIPLINIKDISGLALGLGITMFIQQKMSVKDPSQQSLVYIMPIMFTILFMNFPSGLNLYYFMFNIFSIAQQYYITKFGKEVELKPIEKKKSGFWQKLMEAAEKNAELQRQARKKKK